MISVITPAATVGRPLRFTIQSNTGQVVAASTTAHAIAEKGRSTMNRPAQAPQHHSVIVRSIGDGGHGGFFEVARIMHQERYAACAGTPACDAPSPAGVHGPRRRDTR
jgi:hypothetical protein